MLSFGSRPACSAPTSKSIRCCHIIVNLSFLSFAASFSIWEVIRETIPALQWSSLIRWFQSRRALSIEYCWNMQQSVTFPLKLDFCCQIFGYYCFYNHSTLRLLLFFITRHAIRDITLQNQKRRHSRNKTFSPRTNLRHSSSEMCNLISQFLGRLCKIISFLPSLAFRLTSQTEREKKLEVCFNGFHIINV